MNQKKITLCLVLFMIFISLSSILLIILPKSSIDIQGSVLYANNTNNVLKQKDSVIGSGDIGTMTIVNSDNQTQQQPRINSCLNMMNPGMMTSSAYGSIIGSIKSGPVLNNSFSQIKISLSQAATLAEKEIGNNSHAIEAYLCDANGYLVYMIWVKSPIADITDAIIDPGNGTVLLKNSNLFPFVQQNMSSDNMMLMSGMAGMNH
jgi:hypothetical protein